ncbi:methylammonium permease 2 [Diplocarpon rosae]|nr:methylammonium permease 2 [Diplocarpon rosae]
MATAVVSFQWFFWGYSLAFSHSAGKYLGDLENIGFRNVLGAPSVGSSKIPDLLFAIYQGMFAAITVALAVGAVAERGRMLPTLNYRPHNVTHIVIGTDIVIGTVFLWVGWFGFNAGSALGANLRAVMAAVVTNLAACVGGITWCVLDYRLERKWSTVGFCSGVIAGLVAVTPGSGFVPAWAAVIYGVFGAAGANYATKLKFVLGIDDALDIFAEHAVGGFIGNILTAFFAADYIAHLDGFSVIDGGWMNHHWVQLGYQVADSVAGAAYSFFGTCIILFVMNLIPGLSLRASEEAEILGIDDAEIGEFAYDYVELTREVLNDTDDAVSKYSTNRDSHTEKILRRVSDDRLEAMDHI